MVVDFSVNYNISSELMYACVHSESYRDIKPSALINVLALLLLTTRLIIYSSTSKNYLCLGISLTAFCKKSLDKTFYIDRVLMQL